MKSRKCNLLLSKIELGILMRMLAILDLDPRFPDLVRVGAGNLLYFLDGNYFKIFNEQSPVHKVVKDRSKKGFYLQK